MIYVIDGVIRFNTADYTLEYIPTSDFIKLSLPAGRLLELLMKSDGEILSRDYMLSEVWDSQGLRGSSNNLSQYLSSLRKHMADLGYNEFIITLPKVGVVLNEKIKIHVESNDENNSEKLQSGSIEKKYYTFYLKIVMLGFIILLCSLYYMPSFNNYYEKDKFYLFDNVTVVNCKIIYYKDYSKDELEKLSKSVMQILSENNLICNASSVVYFDHYTSTDINHLGRTLLSYCNIGTQNDYTSCENIYYYDK